MQRTLTILNIFLTTCNIVKIGQYMFTLKYFAQLNSHPSKRNL